MVRYSWALEHLASTIGYVAARNRTVLLACTTFIIISAAEREKQLRRKQKAGFPWKTHLNIADNDPSSSDFRH